MRLVVADTGPVNYLILIGHIGVLPALFEKVILPTAVQDELASRKAPLSVRLWIADSPGWLEVRQAPLTSDEDASMKRIDVGERAAIQLAVSLQASLVLANDRKAVAAAYGKSLNVTGTLGVLELASHRGLVNFAQAVDSLRRTNFRLPHALVDALLKKHEREAGNL